MTCCNVAAIDDSVVSTIPATPINVIAKAVAIRPSLSGCGIKITWNAVNSVSGYFIYSSPTADGDYKLLSASTTTRFVDTSITDGVACYYKISAINSKNEESNKSQSVYAVGDSTSSLYTDPELLIPTNITTTILSSNCVSINWSSTATVFNIYRSDSLDGIYTIVGMISGNPAYTNDSLLAGKTYFYKISALNDLLEESSLSSASLPTTTLSFSAGLPVPQNIITLGIDTSTIRISWDSVENASKYILYTYVEKFEEDTQYRAESRSITYDDIIGIPANINVVYYVTAIINGVESNKSVGIVAHTLP